jgi:hypothetical protein
MNATRFWTVVFTAALLLGCKNSKYCDSSNPTCPSGLRCDPVMHACVVMDGGAGGVGGSGGKTDGGGGGGGHMFRCDASMQCMGHDGGNVCELDAASCVVCVKDGDCKDKANPICGADHLCHPCTTGSSQCAAFDAGTPICTASGCVECTTSADCTADAKRPICDIFTGICAPCTADSQCVAKLGANPGVCMFHQDGHCATDAESVYVQPASVTCVPGAGTAGGTSSMPFCQLAVAVTSAGARRLFVLRGGSITGGTTISNGGPYSLIGQSATITADVGQAGLHVSGTDVYVRGVKIGTLNAATIGIIADGSATIRLDGVEIDNMPQGGLRVTDSAGYDVINSIFAGNGGTRDEGNRFVGGVWIDTPPSNQLSRFAFNTVVSNKRDGVTCASAIQTIDVSLIAGNFSGFADNTGCTLATTSKALGTADPMLTTTYRLTATSPCVDFVTPPPSKAPDHDIDGVTRPQGTAFDCGASEYKPQ